MPEARSRLQAPDTAAPPEVRLVDDVAEAAALAGEWEELAEVCGTGPLSRPRHALAWWRTLGRGRLLLATARVDGRLVVLAPLHERRLGPVRRVRWLGHGLGTVAEMLVSPGHDAAARAAWKAVSTPTRVLDLVEARGDTPSWKVLADLTVKGRRTELRVRDVCPVAVIGGDGLEHVRAPGNRNLRQALRKADRRLSADGRAFRCTVTADPAVFEDLLPAVRAVFDAAEAERPRHHLLEPPYADFVLGYLRESFAAGAAVAIVGYVDDEPASFQILLLTGRPHDDSGVVSLWLCRFAPAFAAYSPGHLTYRAAFTWAAAQGWRQFDLLLGSSQSKNQWSTGWYETHELRDGTPAALAVVDASVRLAVLGRRLAARLGPGR